MSAARRAALLSLGFCVSAALAQPDHKAKQSGPPHASSAEASATPGEPDGAERVFDAAHGLANGWHDYGWAPRELMQGKPAKLDLSNRGGWILARPGLSGAYTGVQLRYRAPREYGDFLEVRLVSARAGDFPRVSVASANGRALDQGWVEVRLPMSALNPRQLPFEQIMLRASKSVGGVPVLIDWIVLTRDGASAALAVAAPTAGGPPAATAAAPLARPAGRPARFVLDCAAAPRPINPWIYGTADGDASLGATAIRWGGNPSTRYNWQVGNAWNAGADWFFKNVDYTKDPTFTYDRALAENLKRGVATALSVPTIGWVAKDTTSYAFPVSVFGPQQAVAPESPDAGNGKAKNGSELKPGEATRTSVAAPPEFIAKWIAAIREKDKARGRSVQMVILDNEPMLWHINHRDIHPKPVSYDELLERTVKYATAVRKADPDVLIAGPAEWGWPGYFFSAVDATAGFALSPDRRSHGNLPLLPWWLANVRARERKLGIKLIDILDVHYYPAAQGVYGGSATDRATNALRLRSTRSLWDPSYTDESWIGEAIALIPRLREWVKSNAPGLGISIGEYSFGAENHPSGGLAEAEALGRFGTEGLTSAFYWRLPPTGSPTYWAFRAFRNFDGAGARFLDLAMPVAPQGERVSLFASRSQAGDHIVAVLLNLDPDEPVSAEIDFGHCSATFAERAFVYRGEASGFVPAPASAGNGASMRRSAPPYSITVLDWSAQPRAASAPAP